MGICSDCVWFDAPLGAYLGRCALWDAPAACNHSCARFTALPPTVAPEVPAACAAPTPVFSILVHEGGCLVRKCGACGKTNMGPRVCNVCQTPWK